MRSVEAGLYEVTHVARDEHDDATELRWSG